MSKYSNRILPVVVAIIVFVLTIHPISSYDTLYDIRVGELIARTHSLPVHEVFSWPAQGRIYLLYEWLFQLILYILHQIGGFPLITWFVAAAAAILYFLYYSLWTKILKHGMVSGIAVSFFLIGALYEFFVPRPHIVAFTGLIAIIILIFLFIFQKKNLLFLSLPVTYIWTNSHASFIFVPYLFFAYALTARSKKLFFWGIANSIVTVLPPLWFGGYQLLIEFSRDIVFISKFISEWQSLVSDVIYAPIYFAVIAVTVGGSFIYTLVKKTVWKRWLYALPLLGIIIPSFTAIRHVSFGSIAALTVTGLILPKPSKNTRTFIMTILCFVVLVVCSSYLISVKRRALADMSSSFPSQSFVKFMKSHHINGNMFNEFSAGGFFVYWLYPGYHNFFDGRAEVYHLHEMRDYLPFIEHKTDSEKDFRAVINEFFHKYPISFIVVAANLGNPLSFTGSTRMADVLPDDPDWKLIFFDDTVQILVKRNGLNDALMNTFGLTIRPFRLVPFQDADASAARDQYLRMSEIAPSSVSFTGLCRAERLMADKQALSSCNRAIAMKPTNGKAYLERGILTRDPNDFLQAIYFEPYLGPAYVGLAQDEILAGDKNKALIVAKTGLAQSDIDILSRQKLAQILNELR